MDCVRRPGRHGGVYRLCVEHVDGADKRPFYSKHSELSPSPAVQYKYLLLRLQERHSILQDIQDPTSRTRLAHSSQVTASSSPTSRHSVHFKMLSRNFTLALLAVMLLLMTLVSVQASCNPKNCCGCSGSTCLICDEVIETVHGNITVGNLASMIQAVSRK